MKLPHVIFIGSFLISAGGLWAEERDAHKTLDGVKIEAVEGYKTPQTNEVTLGAGIFPMNSYYYGFSVGAGYTRYFTELLAWEIVHLTGSFNVKKDLAAELAEDFGVAPQRIEKLSRIFSSNAKVTVSYGKSVLLRQFIQNYRTAVLLGAGVLTTSVNSRFCISLGISYDGYISDTFSWKFEVRDSIALSRYTNFVSFSFGAGLHF